MKRNCKLVIFFLFTGIIFPSIYLPAINPASGSSDTTLDFTVWTNGASFNEGMIIDFNVDFTAVPENTLTITINDLNGSFSYSETVDYPSLTNSLVTCSKIVDSNVTDIPGRHIFEITCTQLSEVFTSYFPLLLNVENIDLLFGYHDGNVTMTIASQDSCSANRGESLTLDFTLSIEDTNFPYFKISEGSHSFFYLIKSTGEEFEFYYPSPVDSNDEIVTFYEHSISFRVPYSWTGDNNSLIPVFSGSETDNLAYEVGDPVLINSTHSGASILLSASTDTVERNNLTQNNRIDYNLWIIDSDSLNYTLDVYVTNDAGSYYQQLLDENITGSFYQFSFKPDHLMNLGYYTLAVNLRYTDNLTVVDNAVHEFKLVDEVALTDYFVNSSSIQPGDYIQVHFSVREQDKSLPVPSNVTIKSDWNGTELEIIFSTETTLDGEIVFTWKVPLEATLVNIPLIIEVFPWDKEGYLLNCTFTKHVQIVSATIISHAEPLKLFRGEETLFEATVYNTLYQPITSGTLVLRISSNIFFMTDLNESNWDQIETRWTVPLNYSTGIEHFAWEFSGNGFNLPATTNFNIAIWSTPRVDLLSLNNTAPVFGEAVKVTTGVVDETNTFPEGKSIEIEFTLRFEGIPVREKVIGGFTDPDTGMLSVILDTSDPFYEQGNYLITARSLADETNCMAESLHQEERRFTLSNGFYLQWNANNTPVIDITQHYHLRGRSNAILTVYITHENGTSNELYEITLDSNGFYQANYTFSEKGNYSLHVVPDNPEDVSLYNPIMIEIYGKQHLTWNIHPDPVPINTEVIDYRNLTVNQALKLDIVSDGLFSLYLNSALTLNHHGNRSFNYNFTQRGIYTLFLCSEEPATWQVNYTCIISVLEQLNVEIAIPDTVLEEQILVAGFTVTCASEGGVSGIIIEFSVLNNETNTGPAYIGTTDLHGRRDFQIPDLIPGIYSLHVSLTIPDGSLFLIDGNPFTINYLYVWSDTIIQLNSLTVKASSSTNLTTTIKSPKGSPLVGIPVAFYYYNESTADITLIDHANTDNNGIASISWVVDLPAGDYYLSVETNASWPFLHARQSAVFKVINDEPVITDFSIDYLGNTTDGHQFLISVEIDSGNTVESVTLTLNQTLYYLTSNSQGIWQLPFQANAGTYSLGIVAADIHGNNDSINVSNYQLSIDSNNNNGNQSTDGSGDQNNSTPNDESFMDTITLIFEIVASVGSVCAVGAYVYYKIRK